jgi:acetylornithine deacetylase/succinyl-diaminopimelate desuccinylase-like protein
MKNIALLFVLATLSGPAQTPASKVDWERQKPETLRFLRELVQIDTTVTPPGNETKAVEYLRTILEAEGIPTQTFALDPNRANLVARLKGNGSKRPILIMSHTDVVPVQREKWQVDPFGAVVKDGYLWGRGSRDDKSQLAAMLEVMVLLKRAGIALDRDVIFLAESGEEGMSQFGAEFMASQHLDAIDAEFAITEGGGGSLDNGRVSTMQFQTTEKIPRSVRLVSTGTSGHASVPRLDNAVAHLSAAVAKAAAWETPMRLNDTTRTYFEKLAGISTPERAARYNALLNPQRAAAAQRYLAEYEPGRYSMLRTSVVPTMLKAGVATNVIPSEAEATVDIRALPDEDMPRFFEEMKRVIGDPSIKIEQTGFGARPGAPPSRLDSEMYRTLEQVSKRMYPGVTVLPTMSTGATDMAFLRAKGIQSYGLGIPSTDEDGLKYGAHSDVERLSVESLYSFTEFTWNVVTEMAAKK